MIISGLIVTYNRVDCLKKSWMCLKEQTRPLDYIIIINNNSTDDTDKFCTELLQQYDNIKYIKLSENTGGAGGFYTGIKLATELDVDYIWGMDDDAYPEPEALENLLKFKKSFNTEKSKGMCLWSNCDQDTDFTGAGKEVTHFMFVGFLIPTFIVKKIGYPRKDFFIYLDDFEYSYRIRKAGFSIFKVRASIINHIAGTQNFYPDKHILGIPVRWAMLPEWKYYYWVRNYILMYPWNDIKKYETIFIKIPNIILKTMLFEKQKCYIMLKAICHGLLGRSGKIQL